jgi:hypothetical protein
MLLELWDSTSASLCEEQPGNKTRRQTRSKNTMFFMLKAVN